MSHFKVIKVTNVDELKVGDTFPRSDFASLTPKGNFFQLEYVEDEEKKLEPYKVHPGIWSIQKTMAGLKLYESGFSEANVLESFVQTKDITDKIDCFFNRLEVYKTRLPGEVPMRRMLLFGPPGGGKSTCISVSAKKYAKDGKTLILIWHTDKFEAHQVKDFIKSFEYVGVERMILLMEDIGGVERDEGRRPSESSLLSLLDNQEMTFTIPTMIVGTTNHPENFLGNLTNRPGRFADKIEVGFPSSEAKKELLRFFANGQDLPTELLDFISSKKCESLTADHIKELFLRADLYERPLLVVARQLAEEIEKYKNAFSGKMGKMGISSDY